jgi:hypothetical protein
LEIRVTDVTAVLALLLSIISLYWQWTRNRPRLKIVPMIRHHNFALIFDGTEREVPALKIRVSNPGEKPVHISKVGLILRKGIEISLSQWLSDPLPMVIDPQAGCEFWIKGPELARELEKHSDVKNLKVAICVTDVVGRVYRSQWFRLSAKQLMRD